MDENYHVNYICRICLKESNVDEFQCVFNTSESTGNKRLRFSEMLMACATVEVIAGDGLPSQICSNCAQDTIRMYSFKIKCEESDQVLRNRLDGYPFIDKIKIDEEDVINKIKLEIKDDEVEESALVDSDDGYGVSQSPHNVEIFIKEENDDTTHANSLPSTQEIDFQDDTSQIGDNLNLDLDQETSLPEKSKKLYMKVYSDFKDWCESKGTFDVSENVLLVYLQEKAINRTASSLWSTFSMLKQTLKLNDNINIDKYHKVIAFLKKKNNSYKPKKAAVFELKDITKFLTEAPDETFLPTKVIFIMGIAGACRTDELCNMKVADIDAREDLIIINIPAIKNKNFRKFVIAEPLWINVVKKYLANRPSPDMEKLLIGFRFGKPVRQNIGHNTISTAPKKIAKYLKLPNPDDYTGHSLRRTSSKIVANKMTKKLTKKHIEDAISDKTRITGIVLPTVPSEPSTNSWVLPSTVPSTLTCVEPSSSDNVNTICLQPVVYNYNSTVMYYNT